jgi:excinuclease ABC subunit B
VVQQEYNRAHGIVPQTIQKAIGESLQAVCEADYLTVPLVRESPDEPVLDAADVAERVAELRKEMREAARQLEFERAAELRDRIRALETRALGLDPASAQ